MSPLGGRFPDHPQAATAILEHPGLVFGGYAQAQLRPGGPHFGLMACLKGWMCTLGLSMCHAMLVTDR
eukprot:12196558-Karenia_brevis.AAC.1